MKKYSAFPAAAALTALLILPVQQYFLSQTSAPAEKPAPLRKVHQEEALSEVALCGNSAGIINMAIISIRNNDPLRARAYLEFGSKELQIPSVLLFYGDYLLRQGEYARARSHYRFALKKALSQNAPEQFLNVCRKRLEEMEK